VQVNRDTSCALCGIRGCSANDGTFTTDLRQRSAVRSPNLLSTIAERKKKGRDNSEGEVNFTAVDRERPGNTNEAGATQGKITCQEPASETTSSSRVRDSLDPSFKLSQNCHRKRRHYQVIRGPALRAPFWIFTLTSIVPGGISANQTFFPFYHGW
jgi:hypothetical protein